MELPGEFQLRTIDRSKLYTSIVDQIVEGNARRLLGL